MGKKPKEYSFSFQLDSLYEQGGDLADAIAELIEENSDLRSTWFGEDGFGMASFYTDKPAVFQVDYTRSSFKNGRIFLIDRTDTISETILTEFIGAGKIIPEQKLLEKSGLGDGAWRDEPEKISRIYFDDKGDALTYKLSSILKDFKSGFAD